MKRLGFVLAFLFISTFCFAQISGTTPVTPGQSVTYTYVGSSIYGYYYWSISPSYGSIQSQSSSGTTYYVTILWNSTGTCTLSFSGYGQLLATKSITINCPTVSTPSSTFTYSSNTCGAKTITRNSNPPANISWYWQTSSTGTDMTYSGNTYTASANGVYYLRAKIACSSWSSALATSSVTVNPTPPDPATPTTTSNSCGPQTLSFNGSPPGGVTWYWQGHNSSGTSTSNSSSTYSATTTGYNTYYLRAYANGCWSNSVSVGTTVSTAPQTPGATLSVSSNTCGTKTVTISGTPPTNEVWHWQGTNPSGTSINSNTTQSVYSSGTYYLRSLYAPSGCWSTSSQSVTITVYPIPADPGAPTTTSNSCGPQTLSFNGSPPGGVTWYWQDTNPNGTSTSNSSSTYSATSVGNYTYYLRAFTGVCWSNSVSVNTTVAPVAQTPYATLTVSSNTCGSKTVTISGTPPANEVWHWQGTNSNGTTINSNTTQTVSASGTYYLRSVYSTSGCWSNSSQSVSVTINDIPSIPGTPTTTSNSCGPQTLSFNGSPPGGVTWYWQNNDPNGTSTGNLSSTFTASVIGNNTYYLRAYNGICWSNAVGISSTVAPVAQTPYATLTVSSNTCGSKTVTISGTPPANEVWHWQGIDNPNGTIINSNTTQTITASGTYYLRSLYMTSGCWSTSSQSVTVTINDPPAPNAPTTTSYSCGPQTLSKNGTPPGGVTWYWQGQNSNGMDYTSPQATGADYSAASSGTYYLRARNTLGCWSPSVSVVVSVNVIPAAPAVPSVSGNTCDAKTLTRANPADGSTWYWQGTTSNGTSTANSTNTYSATLAGTNTYYIRALANGCWSAQTSVVATVVATPAPPLSPVADINTCGSKTLTRPTAPTGVSYFWQGENSNGFDNSSAYAIASTYEAYSSTTYYIRAKADAATCWSASTPINIAVNPVAITKSTYDERNPTIQATSSVRLMPGFVVPAGKPLQAKIVISSECNDFVNWNEEILYNELGTPISASRTYSDGFGNAVESQTKDYQSTKVFGNQSLFNSYGLPVANTLSAPILETEFIYKPNLASNSSGAPYGPNDFDLRTFTGAGGEIANPNAFGNQPGTVGWYYSNSNTLEPNTPTTQFPYARQYVPEGPDPVQATSSSPGDQYKMGSTHEVKSERQLITAGELNHYFSLRNYFVTTPYGANILSNVSPSSTTGFTANGNVTISSLLGNLTVTCNAASVTPGIWPVGGNFALVPNRRYTLYVKGYRSSGTPTVHLYVRNVTTGSAIVWPGAALPIGSANEDWASSSFVVPAGSTGVSVGVLWNGPQVGATFNISAIVLTAESPDMVGYKHISTDQNGKRAATFTDADGRTIATAMITSTGNPPYTYDNWSYTYYNDAGQVVASVAPNGINTGSTALPNFVTYYKYDHLGRMIETTSPDEGTSRFVYTKDGRIRFSESQEQRNANPKRFSYTNYDQLGRPVESGEYSPVFIGYEFEPHTTASPVTYSVLNILENAITVPIDQVTSANYTGVSKKTNSGTYTDYSFITYDQPAAGSPATQTYLIGQVSKTENENATTWYSYDEFGQLLWMKQNIVGLGTKSVDYTYDYFGNVTQVAYQSGQSDQYFHHYEYDLNQRLTHVYTSLNGINKTLHAKYHYYLHGPLKRVELATNMQGIDYVYTITGVLKSINHSDVARDPGSDGSNGFSADVFGQVIDYHDNDYTGAGYSAGSLSTSGLLNQYNGLIKNISWITPVDNMSSRKVYGYSYDTRYQLQNAQFGTVSGTAGSYTATFSPVEAYRENIPAYDKNGNIQSLLRKGKSGNTIGNYSYVYENNTNKLDKVNHNAALLTDYSYNTIGQMVQQTEGGVTRTISYNAYGLTKEVRQGGNLLVSYAYDDRGDLVKKQSYNNGTLAKTTYYVSDAGGNVLAIYEQPNPGTLALAEVPIYGAGRLGMYKPASSATLYEVNDHLGNVRAVIGAPRTETFTATMESEVAASEDLQFKNIAPRVGWVNPTVTPPAPAGNEAVRLNNTRIAGPAIILKVAPGDIISAEVYAYYEGCTDCANTLPLASIVNAVAGAFGGVSGGAGESGQIFNGINGALGGGFGGAAGSGNNNVPAAYLNLISFNNNLDVPNPLELPMAAIPVSSAANWAKQKLTIAPITITTPGYVYIYINNNSNSATQVYFDDMQVTHLHSPFVAGGDFYPFGLTMSDREILTEPYRYGYQGQYSEENSQTGWNEFELRMYEARFGRWITFDPYNEFSSPFLGMGNRPHITTDPTGGLTKYLDEIVVKSTRLPSVGQTIVKGLANTMITSAFSPPHDYIRNTDGSLKLVRMTNDDFDRVKELDGEVTTYLRPVEVKNTMLDGGPLGQAVRDGRANVVKFPVRYARFYYQFAGGVKDFVQTFIEMREADWKYSDKYFHSKANFDATMRGDGGQFAAEKMSNLRESFDMYIKGDKLEWSLQDQAANRYGRMRARQFRVHGGQVNYQEALPKYRPASLPLKY